MMSHTCSDQQSINKYSGLEAELAGALQLRF